jgi:hypothetical protein
MGIEQRIFVVRRKSGTLRYVIGENRTKCRVVAIAICSQSASEDLRVDSIDIRSPIKLDPDSHIARYELSLPRIIDAMQRHLKGWPQSRL